MNTIRLALILLVAIAVFAAWPKREVVVDNHRAIRQFVIQSTLARTTEAVVILGDSIVEASTLPRLICGHAIVNAGISGASTASLLGAMLKDALAGQRAAMIVVSLGLNDAARPLGAEPFQSNYRTLLGELAALTPRRAIVMISSPEAGLNQASKLSVSLIEHYNALLADLASETQATFIALPPMPVRHTIDGIHLNAAGYANWDAAIRGAIEAAICDTP